MCVVHLLFLLTCLQYIICKGIQDVFLIMNLLAHAVLSFNDPDILAGNMISDFVKGSSRFSYTATIQNGIVLHRAIDSFTDAHPATHRAKEVFRPAYRLYSGPITDIIYDHYLANDPSFFTNESLKIFSSDVYEILESYSMHLPQPFLRMLAYMKMNDWLYHYRTVEGIQSSLRGLVRRAEFISDYETACRIFQEHYAHLQTCYNEFFKDLYVFAREKFEKMALQN